jgi:hypothetical protein
MRIIVEKKYSRHACGFQIGIGLRWLPKLGEDQSLCPHTQMIFSYTVGITRLEKSDDCRK